MRRSTAFARPLRCGRPASSTRRTDVSTAACGGVPRNSSWAAPRRSTWRPTALAPSSGRSIRPAQHARRSRPGGAGSWPAAGARRRGRAARGAAKPSWRASASSSGWPLSRQAISTSTAARREARGVASIVRRYSRRAAPLSSSPCLGSVPPERISCMKSVSSFFVDWWRLVVPYFRSEERLDRHRRCWSARSRSPWRAWSVERRLQRMEPALLRQPAEQGRSGVLDGDDQLRLDRRARSSPSAWRARLVSPYLRLRWRRWLTGHYLDALAGRPRLLPHRAGAQGRQRRPAHRRGSAPAGLLHDEPAAGPDQRRGDAGLVPVHPVAAVGSDVAVLHRPRRRDPGLHGLGGADLRLRRHLARQPGRPPTDPAQLPAAALRGELPLRPDAGARECRGHRALSRRAARERGARREVHRRLQQRLARAGDRDAARSSTRSATASSRSSSPTS